jgi:predicted secreted protein
MAITTAKGTILSISDTASPPSYAAISEVRSISGPTVKAKIVDISTHDTLGNWMRKLQVVNDPGEVSFETNYDPTDATQAATTGMWNQMIGISPSGFILSGFKMVFPNSAGTLVMLGYIGQHEFMAPVDNVLACKFQFALTGTKIDAAITFTNP